MGEGEPISEWATRKEPSFLFVNNRLEGNTLSTIEADAEGIER
jgi:hypothetical protein